MKKEISEIEYINLKGLKKCFYAKVRQVRSDEGGLFVDSNTPFKDIASGKDTRIIYRKISG